MEARLNYGWEYVYSSFNDASDSYVFVASNDGMINWKKSGVKG